MTLGDWVTTIVAAGGVVIAALNSWVAISDVRAKRFLGQSKGLLELRDVFAAEGALRGAHASKAAERAHADLLAEFEQESRANAVLYLDAISRLAKPGSLLTGIGQLIYGGVLVWFAISGFPWTASAADPRTIGSIIFSTTLFLAALVLLGLGVRQVVRRLKTRKLRQRVGTLDDLTAEGSAWIKEVPGAIARKMRKK
jgi:hypothetical protein